MTAQKQVFISHTDDQVGNAMQDVLQRAFDGKVRCFNTSRSTRGLSSGVRIDDGLLESLQESDLFLSVWTPGAVARPAWMCWELGVAVATRTKVLVARALGAEVDQLPLGLGGRFANDLGDEDSLVRLVEDLAEILQTPSDTARVRDQFAAPHHSVFHARHSLPKISITTHRKYLLVENVSRTELDDLKLDYAGADSLEESLAHAIDRALHKNNRALSAAERLVVALPDERRSGVLPPTAAGSPDHDIVVRGEWRAPDVGREWSDITIFGADLEF